MRSECCVSVYAPVALLHVHWQGLSILADGAWASGNDLQSIRAHQQRATSQPGQQKVTWQPFEIAVATPAENASTARPWSNSSVLA